MGTYGAELIAQCGVVVVVEGGGGVGVARINRAWHRIPNPDQHVTNTWTTKECITQRGCGRPAGGSSMREMGNPPKTPQKNPQKKAKSKKDIVFKLNLSRVSAVISLRSTEIFQE